MHCLGAADSVVTFIKVTLNFSFFVEFVLKSHVLSCSRCLHFLCNDNVMNVCRMLLMNNHKYRSALCSLWVSALFNVFTSEVPVVKFSTEVKNKVPFWDGE